MKKHSNNNSRCYLKEKRWVVRSERPEEAIGEPKAYYSDEEVARYSRSGGMRTAQKKIALRIIVLLGLQKNSRILDLGCGPGFTMEVYLASGYSVAGIDVIHGMIQKAREKKLNVVEGDMRALEKYFKPNEFDAVVSASALQWIKNPDEIKNVAEGIKKILKPKGKLVMQFYPRSEKEFFNVAKIFSNCGFQGNMITDNPDNPRKRLVFLVMEKC